MGTKYWLKNLLGRENFQDRQRWEYNIKIDLREPDVKWIELV
jgi:hypothetical protein